MTTETVQKTKLLTPLLLLFMVTMILANLGGSMYGPLEALYLKDLGAGIGQIGLFYTLSQIIPLALQILGGWISDSLGRLRAIAIGSVVGVLVYIPLLLATRWEWVLVASAFSAVTRSLIGPSFDAFIADHSAPENRARLFGITQTLFGIVSVVGPIAGGYLVEWINFKGMLAVAAALYLIATFMRIGMAREAARGHEANPAALTFSSLKTNLGAMVVLILAGGLFTWILITDGVRDIFFGMSMSFLSVYMQDIASLTISQIGFMNSIFGLAMMAVMIPAGWLADKVGERVNIAISFLLLAFSIGMIALIPPQSPAWVYAIGWTIAGIGSGLGTPAYQSLISKAVPQRLRGVAFGLFSTSLGLVSLPAPMIGGYLWEHVSPQFPFLLTAGISLLSIIPVWLKFKTSGDVNVDPPKPA
ncbi:MAG TPA: MFS transporter [Anaerolineaceae bacterium]|nr:MFS transporter [Anaerolineaceae bacterium]HQH86274.1 MFS transporter [Anaerolineaceae bacterium]